MPFTVKSAFAGSVATFALVAGAVGVSLPRPSLPPVPVYRTILPLEVTSARTIAINITGPGATVYMQIHGLEQENEGTFQADNQPAIPLTNSTATVEAQAKAYGGIGGGFATLGLSLPVTLSPGIHFLRWRMQPMPDAAGIEANSEYRILSLDIRDAQGNSVIAGHPFLQHDVTRETPPLPSAADINQGKYVWKTAKLTDSPMTHTPLQAGCGSCHAADGQDLKYFGYTNNDIYQRCKFHGFTDLQARQVASYIRALPIATYGRPWNPPYQPGPGMDSKPVEQWAAGAGLSAVLPSDAALLPYLFPQSITPVGLGQHDTLNMRELPTELQLPDWNHWLPRIHPLDAWGSMFTNSSLAKYYDQPDGPSIAGSNSILQALSNPDAGYHAFITQGPGAQLPNLFGTWHGYYFVPFLANLQGNNDHTPLYAEKWESTGRWFAVKQWELMKQFALEGNAPSIYPTASGAPTAGENRSWFSEAPFYNSDNFMGIPNDGVYESNLLFQYKANVWYRLQTTLNAGNRHRKATHPDDWGYQEGRAQDLSRASGLGSTVRMAAMLIKAIQQDDTNNTVDTVYGLWPHFGSDVRFFYWGKDLPVRTSFSSDPVQDAATFAQIATAVTSVSFDALQTHTPAEYQASDQWGDSKVTYAGDSLFNMQKETLSDLTQVGVDPALLRREAAWNGTVWNYFNWNSLLPAQ